MIRHECCLLPAIQLIDSNHSNHRVPVVPCPSRVRFLRSFRMWLPAHPFLFPKGRHCTKRRCLHAIRSEIRLVGGRRAEAMKRSMRLRAICFRHSGNALHASQTLAMYTPGLTFFQTCLYMIRCAAAKIANHNSNPRNSIIRST